MSSIGHVAYYVDHADGLQMGTLSEANQVGILTDISGGSGEIRTFLTKNEAIAWLKEKATEFGVHHAPALFDRELEGESSQHD